MTTTPVLYDDVSDLGVVLAMCACRRIAAADRFVRAGRWLKGRMPPAQKFSRKRAGILGLGRIGNALAPRLQAFGMTIGFYDPLPKAGVPWQAYASPLELAQNSDILFLCAAGGPGRAPHRRRARSWTALGPKGVFVNIARGWLVDEAALVEALKEGRLGAAGLDVFEDEPEVPEALLGMDNVVLTPHIASNTEETMRAMGELRARQHALLVRRQRPGHAGRLSMAGKARLLAGQVALVTGAGRGLGRAFAERLAALGAAIGVHGMREHGPAEYGEGTTLSATAARSRARTASAPAACWATSPMPPRSRRWSQPSRPSSGRSTSWSTTPAATSRPRAASPTPTMR